MADRQMADRAAQAQTQSVRAGFFDRDAFKQKTRLVLVLQTAIAGLRYCVDEGEEEDAAILRALTPGTELHLFREPDNAADPLAIAVYTVGGRKLGYVPHFKNETVARLMDQGKAFRAYIDAPPPPDEHGGSPDGAKGDGPPRRRMRTGTEDERVPFSVYLEE